MEIKAVKFRKEGFYTQPFVMGGEEGSSKTGQWVIDKKDTQ
jgi:hypothetical protein